MICALMVAAMLTAGCDSRGQTMPRAELQERAEQIAATLLPAADGMPRDQDDIIMSEYRLVDGEGRLGYWLWDAEIVLPDDTTVSPEQLGEAMSAVLTENGWVREERTPISIGTAFHKNDLGGVWTVQVSYSSKPAPTAQRVRVVVVSPEIGH